MNRIGQFQLIGLVGLIFFLGVLYIVNYELQKETTIYLTSNGFSQDELNIRVGEYISIYNNDTSSRILVIDGELSPNLEPKNVLRYKFIKKGEIYIEIRDRLTLNSILKIKVY